MKRILLAMAIVLVAVSAQAQVLTLNTPETLAVPTAPKLFLKEVNINVQDQTVKVVYQFMTEDNQPIPMPRTSIVDRAWYCSNRAAQLAENCTGLHEPYFGCTGVGIGENLDPGSTCFSDTFGFAVRSQDVGVQIGKGLRALIWSKMRPDILTGTNNATLP